MATGRLRMLGINDPDPYPDSISATVDEPNIDDGTEVGGKWRKRKPTRIQQINAKNQAARRRSQSLG